MRTRCSRERALTRCQLLVLEKVHFEELRSSPRIDRIVKAAASSVNKFCVCDSYPHRFRNDFRNPYCDLEAGGKLHANGPKSIF